MFVVTALFFFNIFKFTWNPKRIELRAYPAPASIIPTENVINRVLTNSKNLPIDKRLTAIFQTLVFFRNFFEKYFIQNGFCSFFKRDSHWSTRTVLVFGLFLLAYNWIRTTRAIIFYSISVSSCMFRSRCVDCGWVWVRVRASARMYLFCLRTNDIVIRMNVEHIERPLFKIQQNPCSRASEA